MKVLTEKNAKAILWIGVLLFFTGLVFFIWDELPLNANKIKAGGIHQKLILFIRGKAISAAPINKGTNQLPKPPNKIGITIKKIIINAWAVIIVLYN